MVLSADNIRWKLKGADRAAMYPRKEGMQVPGAEEKMYQGRNSVSVWSD